MLKLFVCKTEKSNEIKRLVSISIPEQHGIIKNDVPIFESVRIPRKGDTVVAIFEVEEGRLGRGFIIGRT